VYAWISRALGEPEYWNQSKASKEPLRVDTVHQGDLDGVNDVDRINDADAVSVSDPGISL
jgi:hypothetical protein